MATASPDCESSVVPDQPALVSITYCAQVLGLCLPSVRKLLGKELRDVRIGRRRLVTASSLRVLIGEQAAASESAR